jgi:hypothetical protein
MARIATIISGGQSGVDRAALDVAVERGIPYRGFVPEGGWAGDFSDPPGLLARYPHLVETASRDPKVRTEKNVLAADATLVVVPGEGRVRSPGTDLTLEAAARHGRPCLTVAPSDPGSLEKAAAALRAMPGEIALNVAGPRESEAPGIHRAARRVLEALLDGLES